MVRRRSEQMNYQLLLAQLGPEEKVMQRRRCKARAGSESFSPFSWPQMNDHLNVEALVQYEKRSVIWLYLYNVREEGHNIMAP